MAIEKKLLAFCGLYCGVCGVYYATRDHSAKFLHRLLDMYREKIPGLENVTIDDLKCDGCMSDRVSLLCRGCSIKACSRQKGTDGCHECDAFPCEHIQTFPVAVGKKVILRAVPYRREHGTAAWVEHEETRYLCPSCGHTVFRGAKRCNRCKTEIDLD